MKPRMVRSACQSLLPKLIATRLNIKSVMLPDVFAEGAFRRVCNADGLSTVTGKAVVKAVSNGAA